MCLDYKVVFWIVKVFIFIFYIKSGLFIEDFLCSSSWCCLWVYGVLVGLFLFYFLFFDINYLNFWCYVLIMNNIWISM